MEQKIKEPEINSKFFWQSIIAFIVIVLVVLAGSIIIILLQWGHSISGKEVISGAAFPLLLFIPIWVVFAKKMERPAAKQVKIIKAMLITALILFIVNVLLFWIL